MMSKVTTILILFLFGTAFVNATETAWNFKLWRDVGEKKTPNYFGVKAPDVSRVVRNFSPEKESPSEDDQYLQLFMKDKLQAHPIELTQFWFEDLITESLCPNEELAENIEYIRYLYRLMTISYSFESVKRAKKLSDGLGLKTQSCSLIYKDLFGSCRPKTIEMKKFHTRVSGKFANEIEKMKFERLTSKEIESWWKEYARTINLTLDPILSRINDDCLENMMSCRDYKETELADSLNRICQTDRKLIDDACNERDDLLGISNSAKVTELIKNSNAFNLINKNGYGENCLRRFVAISNKLERRYTHLQRLYTLMNAEIIKDKSRYPQGDLFLPGALKEFDVKGLSDFLVALEPPKPKPVLKFKPKPKPIVKKPEPVIAKVETPKVVEAPKVEVVEAPKPKISEFERALADLKRFNSARAEMDMDLFRADFEFTQDQFSALEIPLKRFQTRAALVDMKTYDKMGSKDSPIGLMFVKFLMDTENHQGLFNIQAIIGSKFYVINDFESKNEPVAIELKNDETTRGKWAIVLLKTL